MNDNHSRPEWIGRALAADRGLLGQMLETFVLQELRRQASGMTVPIIFHHFRDRDGVEVDLVRTVRGRVAGGAAIETLGGMFG